MPEDAGGVQRLRQYLYELAGCEDDVFVVDMLRAFLESAAESAESLRHAEAMLLARTAHRLKSSFSTLGLHDGARACALLEVAALDGDQGQVYRARRLVDEQRRHATGLVQALLGEMEG